MEEVTTRVTHTECPRWVIFLPLRTVKKPHTHVRMYKAKLY
jgi:hypothetical protein